LIRTLIALAGITAFVGLAVACSSSGEGGREIPIAQGQEGCTPETIAAAPGEKLNLVVTNDSDKEPYEVEGEGGTKLEEIIVPQGKTREVGFDVPDEPGTYEIKCYVPGDLETIIDVEVKAAGATEDTRY
jgi:plastocyanin